LYPKKLIFGPAREGEVAWGVGKKGGKPPRREESNKYSGIQREEARHGLEGEKKKGDWLILSRVLGRQVLKGELRVGGEGGFSSVSLRGTDACSVLSSGLLSGKASRGVALLPEKSPLPLGSSPLPPRTMGGLEFMEGKKKEEKRIRKPANSSFLELNKSTNARLPGWA